MELKEITEKMLELLNVKSTEELSDRLFEVVKNNDMTIYEKFCEIVENDLSVDWMQMIFQYTLQMLLDMHIQLHSTTAAMLSVCSIITKMQL